MVKAALLALWVGLTALPAWGQTCRLALVLALDVSSSVDDAEWQLQRDGLTAALDDPDIRGAILAGPGYVALSVYEWSGRWKSALVSDWIALTDHDQIDLAIARIRAAPRSETEFPTAMGYALGFGANLLRRAAGCSRKVIDLSGDGITNDGFGPDRAYAHFPFEGVTVNGLAVLGADPMVEDYFLDEVRHGPGAFVELSDGYAGYRRAMTRKLFREINDMVLGSTVPGGTPPG